VSASPGRRQGRDLLRAPLIGPLLRWRHTRTVLQATCLVLAALIILDGLFGPEVAPRNLAGTVPWVHWRGFVVLGLLVVGNLFCMACPFMLPRRLAKKLFPANRSWPRALGSKWVAVALLLLFFWAYEAFHLWSSPWLTAWVAISYFVLAFAVDAFFKGAAFCKHVCPIGQFHFVNGMASPAEIQVRDLDVCSTCTTKDCIRGRYEPGIMTSPAGRGSQPSPGQSRGRTGLLQSGCELSLFQPRKVGNLDCTFCLECVHACPHDNVGLLLRSPVRELSLDPTRSGIGRMTRRPDLSALAGVMIAGAFFNAFGMVAPGADLRSWMTSFLPTGWEHLDHLLATAAILAAGMILLPMVLLALTARMSVALAGRSRSILRCVSTYIWALVPLGLGMWAAHYLFHLLVGGLTIVPVMQEYLSDLGLTRGGRPGWEMGPLVPDHWLFPIQIVLLQGGAFLALIAGFRIAEREEADRDSAFRAFAPWAVLAIGLTLAGIWVLAQPMEMRGTLNVL